MTVNPVKRQFVQGQRGKLMPHLTEEQQLAWFDERSSGWGFETLEFPQERGTPDEDATVKSVRVVQWHDRVFGKLDGDSRRTVTQRQVTIAGQLRVTSADLLRSHLTGGMGRGKAYGCGLMTLARAR